MSLLGRYLAVALFLAGLLAGTFALQQRAEGRLSERPEAAQADAVARVQALVEREVAGIQADLLRRAEALAAHPAVRRSLLGGGEDEVVAVFAGLRLPDGYAAELYTPTPELVAWRGPSLPLDPATRMTRFLSVTQASVASDAGLRQALVIWLPVREGERVLGAVRMVRIVRAQVPVRNQYLRDFDLVEQWRARAGLPFAVQFGSSGAVSEDSALVVRGLDGAVLAVASVPPPSLELLRDQIGRRYGDVLAFWGVLLMGWGVFGLWLVQVQGVRRAERRKTGASWAVAGAGLIVVSAGWVAVRYGLLVLQAPARWFGGVGGAAEGGSAPALFDPVNLASGIGSGVLGSVGELFVTALFAVAAGVAWAWFGVRALRFARGEERARGASGRPDPGWLVRAGVGAGAAVGVVGVAGALIRRATLDATLPYFDRAGPLPEELVVIVFGAFLLITLAALLVLVALGVMVRLKGWRRFAAGMAVAALMLAAAYATTPFGTVMPWFVAAGWLGVAAVAAWGLEHGPDLWAWPLTLRGALATVVAVAALTYPVVRLAAEDKRTAQILDYADEFADGEDARVAFALEGVLLDARASTTVREALTQHRRARRAPGGDALGPGAPFDSLASDLVTGSLLVSLADYTISLTLLSPSGDTLGTYREAPPPGADPEFFGPPAVREDDALSFQALRSRYAADTAPGFVVEREAAPGGRGKYRYAGVGPIRRDSDAAIVGWVTAQAEPKPARYVSETPFPRVLVPAGFSGIVEGDLAVAEFRHGVLVRSRGGDFGRFRLPPEVDEALRETDALWQRDRVGGLPVRFYYRRLPEEGRVIAVREPGVVFYDHLYFFLRLLVPGLALGLVGYAVGVGVRRQAGVLARRSRLRDRVLNRFLFVGILSVALTGLIGQEVIVEQNRQAVQDRLKRRLARVEAALFAEVAQGGAAAVPLTRLLDRARPDVIGPRLGLDVNLYRRAELVASSRSQLVRQQLIDRRLPVEVYEALFVRGERYAFAEEQIGTFTYTTGYEALPDEAGRPGAVIAIPTLPEQATIEADQARMIAYLFGVLLLLLGGIFLITTLLANRLTQPFRRLRAGLLAVGAGEEGGEPIPVESSDEVGELIETFNAMRSQLETSRRKLAQQERELAWREMARQVAHEIKNPLTPMKLSVQHLRRAHDEQAENGRFGPLLDRITGTLIEQIDALTRIANEFSSFARLPRRHLERLDLNEVVREAAALSAEAEHAALVLDLADAPLPIRADREELRRVYINLLTNALQAMPEDELGTLAVRTERREAGPDGQPGAWAFSAVRDTGTGIPEEAQDKVFQPNFSTKTSGMGLGLAISKKAVEDLHGDIAFETRPGVGTTFYVWLPIAGES